MTAEQHTAWTAALRAAAEAAHKVQESDLRDRVSRAFRALVHEAEETPEREPEWRAAMGALLRELAPAPDGELAEAEGWWRVYVAERTPRHMVALLAEYDRRGAENEALRVELAAHLAVSAGTMSELIELRAMLDGTRAARDSWRDEALARRAELAERDELRARALLGEAVETEGRDR